jgi:hypothetical protein
MASIFKTCACPNKARCSHSWIVRYRQQSFPAKRQATAFAARIEADKIVGAHLDSTRAQIPFADYAADWLATRILRPTTIDQYVRNLRNHALPAFGHLPLANLTRPLSPHREERPHTDPSRKTTAAAIGHRPRQRDPPGLGRRGSIRALPWPTAAPQARMRPDVTIGVAPARSGPVRYEAHRPSKPRFRASQSRISLRA